MQLPTPLQKVWRAIPRRVREGLRYSLAARPPEPPSPHVSETSKCRGRLAPFCTGFGLDIGFGGDPITPHAVRFDLPTPYASVGQYPVQLGGDATALTYFRDGVLDFVYSSHVLEDFADVDAVLREWLRVLKPGGRLVLFCPDEPVYRAHCARTGQPYNTNHKHADFSSAFVIAALGRVGGGRVVHHVPLIDVYSWELVIERTTAPGAPA